MKYVAVEADLFLDILFYLSQQSSKAGDNNPPSHPTNEARSLLLRAKDNLLKEENNENKRTSVC